MRFSKIHFFIICGVVLSFQSINAQRISLSLNEALEVALKNNIEIQIAKNQVNSSEFALKESKGNFLPKLFLTAGYNRNIDKQVIFLPDGFGLGGSATELGSDNDYRAALNLNISAYSYSNIANKKLSKSILARLNHKKKFSSRTGNSIHLSAKFSLTSTGLVITLLPSASTPI